MTAPVNPEGTEHTTALNPVAQGIQTHDEHHCVGCRCDVATTSAAKSERLQASILRWLAGGPLPRRDLLRKSNSRDRRVSMTGGASPVIEALGQLIAASQVAQQEEIRRGNPTLVYRKAAA